MPTRLLSVIIRLVHVGPASGGAEGQTAEEAAREAAEREAVQAAYVQAWLAKARELGESAEAAGPGDDKKAALAGVGVY